MLKPILILIFLVAVAPLSPRPAITGVVKDVDGVVIPDVKVTATARSGEGIDVSEYTKGSKTGVDGRYVISGLHSDVYAVQFSKKGYGKVVFQVMTKREHDTVLDAVLRRNRK